MIKNLDNPETFQHLVHAIFTAVLVQRFLTPMIGVESRSRSPVSKVEEAS